MPVTLIELGISAPEVATSLCTVVLLHNESYCFFILRRYVPCPTASLFNCFTGNGFTRNGTYMNDQGTRERVIDKQIWRWYSSISTVTGTVSFGQPIVQK